MDTLKTAVSSVSVLMIMLGVVMMLVPEGKMQKPLKTFVSVVVVFGIVTAFGSVPSVTEGADFRLSKDSVAANTSLLNGTLTGQNISVAEAAVKSMIEERIVSAGVKNAEISVKADISKDNRIYITDVTVVCDSESMTVCHEVLAELSITANFQERK